jgi:hypothetical protein
MRKTLMCAFLALSLVGGQLSAYKDDDHVTPSRLGCVNLHFGKSKEEAKSKVEELKQSGLKNSKGEHFAYDNGKMIQRFKNAAGESLKFKDLANVDKETREAIAKSNDTCATKFYYS